MEITNLIVARFADGRVLKGHTNDFVANRPLFHVEVEGTNQVLELRCKQLKAVFFVKSLEGDPARQDLHGFVSGPAETSQGKKIAVRFKDGEFLCGYTLSWLPDREGFFLFPADAYSNNQRIYVITAATAEVKAGPAAEALAQRALGEQKQSGAAAAGTPNVAAPPRPRLITGPTGLTPRPNPPGRTGTDR